MNQDKKVFYTSINGDVHQFGESYSDIPPMQHATASSIYSNVLPDISIRDSFSRKDMEAYRPNDRTPKTVKEEMAHANMAYKRVGLIRNVMDLMSDFGCQGIALVHKSKKWQKFYREWAKKIDFVERSERFLNLFYRLGNVIVQRHTAKINKSDIKRLNKGFASPNIKIEKLEKPEKQEIPWDYEFFNPVWLDVVGGELANFVGKPIYAVELNSEVAAKIKNPKGKIEKELVAQIPQAIVAAVKKGETQIVLDPSRTFSYFYKKDDWESWASPMLSSIVDDLIHFNKLRLADNAALDGAISHLRIWKLGSLDKEIMPSAGAFAKLAEILMNNSGTGAMDLIWGPDIELQETSTELSKFLGSEKYAQTLNNIYSGLGVPPTLTGSSSTGFTNNMVSIKTLIERLEYGRTVLREFWERELKLVQQAMGIKEPAEIVFERATLTDEVAEKALWIQLADRDIITVEAVQKRFGVVPEVENIIRKQEERARTKNKMPKKAGPYHNANIDDDLLKLSLQQGTLNPDQAGVKTRNGGPTPNKSVLDISNEQATKVAKISAKNKPTGVSGQGRPKTSNDKKKRKTRTAKPIGSAKGELLDTSFLLNLSWASEAQKTISNIVNPIYFEAVGKKDLRSLSDNEFKGLEEYKTGLLFNYKVGEKIDSDNVKDKTIAGPIGLGTDVINMYKQTVSSFNEKFGKEPTLDEQRRIYATIYAMKETDNVDS